MKKLICITLSVLFIFCFSGCLDESTFSLTPSPTNKGAVLYTPKGTTPAPVTKETSTPTETEIPTEKPTKKPTQKPTATPTQKPTNNSPGEVLVWIPTNGGKKYHSKSSCSGMKNPQQVTKSSAVSQGFSACGKCY